MTEPIFPSRRHGGRRHKRVRIYDTQALMELFGTDEPAIAGAQPQWDYAMRLRRREESPIRPVLSSVS
jgi:hypothetical protein